MCSVWADNLGRLFIHLCCQVEQSALKDATLSLSSFQHHEKTFTFSQCKHIQWVKQHYINPHLTLLTYSILARPLQTSNSIHYLWQTGQLVNQYMAWLQPIWRPIVRLSPTKVVVSCILPHQGRVLSDEHTETMETGVYQLRVWSCRTAFQLNCDKLTLAFNDINGY